ncbi:RHS repeat-associated core domain-containing protein, partial [Mycobacterium tuberculosis]|nr:RHS repeat-associated core domain-containing protein [Mycobacterium tuberculosis]
MTQRKMRHAGKERDATGLYFYGWRYYQPEIGRWLSADPGGMIDGVNLFRMVKNSPVNFHDDDGLAPFDVNALKNNN